MGGAQKKYDFTPHRDIFFPHVSFSFSLEVPADAASSARALQ
jgi:hypothetical protein